MLFSENEKQRAARDACIGFFNGCSVFLAYGNDGAWASGVVFRTASGVPLLLTARHVVETLPEIFKIGNVSAKDARAVMAATVIVAPPRPVAFLGDGQEPNVDVAAIVLSSDSWPVLPQGACTEDQLCLDDENVKTDVLILTGYPAFLAVDLRETDRAIALSFVNHGTGITGRDQYGRLKVEWDQAIPASGARHPHVDAAPGKAFKLGSPGGISGGGFWRIRGSTNKEEVWAPARRAHLLGVACSWNLRDTEFIEPVGFWADWFLELLRNTR